MFTLVVTDNGDYTFRLLRPVDHPDATDPNDVVQLTFEVAVTDADGDTDTGSIVIDLADDGPQIADDTITPVKESDLGPVTVNGDLTEDFGADGGGEITTNDTFTATGLTAGPDLTSGGEIVTISTTATGYEGTIPDGLGGTITVFSLEITDQTTGAYEFTLNQPLDHANDADNNPANDFINLNFGVQIEDFDGDQDDATITIQILDDNPTIPGGDTPEIGKGQENVDESDIGTPGATQTGSVPFDFGDDGAGEFCATGGHNINTLGLTSGGQPVTVAFDSATGTYTATNSGGDTVFTLVVEDDGDYTFELLGNVDHPDDTDPNDSVVLRFDVKAEDADGDVAEGQIVINLFDDAPVAEDDTNTVVDSAVPVTGNVTDNDDSGEDTPATLTNVNFDGTDYPVVPGVATTITTPYGELEISETGEYTYTSNGTNNAPVAEQFTYSYTDADGDTDTAVLTININDVDYKPEVSVENLTTDETDIDGTSDTDSGTITANFGGDGPGTFSGNNTFNLNGLTSQGQPIDVQYNAGTNTYTGTSHGDTIFTFVVDAATGDYTFTLLDQVDHADASDPNDATQITFGVLATDSDDDSTPATVTVTILDDGPVAEDDSLTFDADDVTATGDVTENDTFSEDEFAAGKENKVTEVQFGTDTVTIPDGGSNTIDGDYGTLEISSDGTYTYTLTNPGGIGGAQTATFDPVEADVSGVQESLTLDGITISVSNTGDYDLVWLDTADGSGIGIDNLNSGDTPKIFSGEGLDISADQPAETMTITIAELGDNNDNGDKGADLIVTLEDGTEVTVEVQFTSADITDGEFTFTLDSADYGQLITSVNLTSTNAGDYDASSMLLNEVSVTYPHEECVVDEFEYTLIDSDGDTDTATLTIKAKDVNNDKPKLSVEDLITDETDITDTDGDTDSGTITADFGADGPGTFAGEGAASVDLNGLTSGGQPIDVTYDAATLTYTGADFNGDDVFTFVVDATTGEYTFELLGNVDHPIAGDDSAGEHNDAVQISFGVTATDNDGDVASADVNVTILDDGPSIQTSQFTPVDESDLSDTSPLVVNKTLDHDFGADGAGTIRPVDGGFSTLFQVGGNAQTLTSNGNVVDVNVVGNQYIGTVGADVIFTLDVRDDGSYTYTQNEAIDHPDTTNTDDVIWLKFEVEITDGDGDTDTAIIGIDVHDDGNCAIDDLDVFAVSDGVTDGDVITNDHLSQDDPNTVTKIAFGGVSVDIPENGSNTIDGDFGTLEINSDGTYEYALFDNPTPPGGGEKQTVYNYSIDNPGGGDAAGDIKNVDTSFNADTQELTFSTTVEPSAEGFTVAISPGDNPKGHGGELALFYFDASTGTPVVTAYNYNGVNAQTSWFDGSAAAGTQNADPIVSSLSSPNAFSNIEVTIDANGNKVFTFTMDASVVNNFDPAYGPDGDWTGAAFGEQIGIWLHPVEGLDTSYGQDGFLTDWDAGAQSYYDVGGRDTEVMEICPCHKQLDPAQEDTHGVQESITKDGITVTIANQGDYDITWVDTADGSGLGIDNLNANDSLKVWSPGEAFDISFDQLAETVTLTIAEIGDNNDDGQHGLDYIVTLADGTEVVGEQQFTPGEINNGYFDITLEASDYGQAISSVEIKSTNDGDYKAASFLLNDVHAECVEGPELTDTLDQFTYTLTDADGDSTTAVLTLQGDAPKLVEGTGASEVLAGGEDSDVLFGNGGADVFLFDAITQGVDTIKDFAAGDDVLDLSGLLQGYDAVQDSINDFVFASEANDNTTISVDVDGAAGPATAVDLVVLEGATGLDIVEITNDGQAAIV